MTRFLIEINEVDSKNINNKNKQLICVEYGHIQIQQKVVKQIILFSFLKLRRRGPDNLYIIAGFHRLQILDPIFHGNQPFLSNLIIKQLYLFVMVKFFDYKELINVKQPSKASFSGSHVNPPGCSHRSFPGGYFVVLTYWFFIKPPTTDEIVQNQGTFHIYRETLRNI